MLFGLPNTRGNHCETELSKRQRKDFKNWQFHIYQSRTIFRALVYIYLSQIIYVLILLHTQHRFTSACILVSLQFHLFFSYLHYRWQFYCSGLFEKCSQDKMVYILRRTFSDTFYWSKSYVFGYKLQCNFTFCEFRVYISIVLVHGSTSMEN